MAASARCIALCLLIATTSFSAVHSDDLNDPTVPADHRFALFKNKYEKAYATKEEHDYRSSVFKSNLDAAGIFPYFVDQFADLTSHEFLRRLPYPIHDNLFLLQSHTNLALSCVNAYKRVVMGVYVGQSPHTCSARLKHNHPFSFGDDEHAYVLNELKETETETETESPYANSPGPNGPEEYRYQNIMQIKTLPHPTTSYEMK